MKILAADLSSHVGWAVGEHDAEPTFGTFDLPKTGIDVGRFCYAFKTMLEAMIRLHAPELYVFEEPLKLVKSSFITQYKLMGLAAVGETIAFDHGLKCEMVKPSVIKSFYTHRGNAKKEEMILAAQQRGFRVTDDHQADAVALWSYAVHQKFLDQRHRWALGQMGAAA